MDTRGVGGGKNPNRAVGGSSEPGFRIQPRAPEGSAPAADKPLTDREKTIDGLREAIEGPIKEAVNQKLDNNALWQAIALDNNLPSGNSINIAQSDFLKSPEEKDKYIDNQFNDALKKLTSVPQFSGPEGDFRRLLAHYDPEYFNDRIGTLVDERDGFPAAKMNPEERAQAKLIKCTKEDTVRFCNDKKQAIIDSIADDMSEHLIINAIKASSRASGYIGSTASYGCTVQ